MQHTELHYWSAGAISVTGRRKCTCVCVWEGGRERAERSVCSAFVARLNSCACSGEDALTRGRMRVHARAPPSDLRRERTRSR